VRTARWRRRIAQRLATRVAKATAALTAHNESSHAPVRTPPPHRVHEGGAQGSREHERMRGLRADEDEQVHILEQEDRDGRAAVALEAVVAAPRQTSSAIAA